MITYEEHLKRIMIYDIKAETIGNIHSVYGEE